MLGTHHIIRTIAATGIFTDESNVHKLKSNSLSSPSPNQLSVRLTLRIKQCRRSTQLFSICCKSSSFHDNGSFSGRSGDGDGHDRDYLEASVLVSDTSRHYLMRRNGFREDMNWKPYSRSVPFYVQAIEEKSKLKVNNALGLEILRRFQTPTIFLKISCDGDFVLPISVGEYAVEALIDEAREDDNGNYANQFQFLINLVEKLGYEVKMVRITEKVINTYLARMYFSKPGERDILTVNVRTSDAINIAKICKAPIYVNKQIVWTDAMKVVNGMSRLHNTKSIYDVTLDSAIDGQDLLCDEFIMLKNMSSAAEEERYNDAAMWRDKLNALRRSESGH